MGGANVQVVAHTVVAVAVIIAYAALTATGHDANTLLGLLAGQGIGAAISTTAVAANGKPPVTVQVGSPVPPPVPPVTP